MSLVIAMAVIGGIESLIGATLGAIFIHFSLEWLQKIPIPAVLMPRIDAIAPTLENLGFTLTENAIQTNAWRMVGFGLLLMVTLRFWQNGLIYPVIQRLTRRDALKETVSKRQAASVEETVSEHRSEE
jgi:branched-chain amino acid transport system permease protein